MAQNKTTLISFRATDEQAKFLKNWQSQMEEQLSIEVPMGAVMRRLVDGFMRDYAERKEQGEAPKITDEQMKARNKSAIKSVTAYQDY
jgi:hypothetical protein